MASGDLLDLSQWAARTARFDVDTAADMTLAKAAVNDAYLSTCGSGDPFDFLYHEGQWTTTAATDVYTYATIATAMGITSGTIAEIEAITDETGGPVLESSDWRDLEMWAQSTQDDADARPTRWSKWASRIRLFPTPNSAYTLGSFVRLAPAEMTLDAAFPLIPAPWRRRLLVPYAAAILIRTEGGIEAGTEAGRLMNRYDEDFVRFRTAYATAKRPTFRVSTPGWEVANSITRGGVW